MDIMMTSAVDTSIQDTSPLLTVSTIVGVEAALEAAAAAAGAEASAAGALAAATVAAGADAALSAANVGAANPRTASPRAREARSFLMVARLSGVGSVWRLGTCGSRLEPGPQSASLPVSPVRM